MILQRQYSLWKGTTIILLMVTIGLIIATGFFKFGIIQKSVQINSIKKELSTIENEIKQITTSSIYKKYEMAKEIYNRENHTNYVALYSYLKSIKDDITKMLSKENLRKFELQVNKEGVKISTVVPNYNYLYNGTGGIFYKLIQKPFIKKIYINNYKSDKKGVMFDIELKTK